MRYLIIIGGSILVFSAVSAGLLYKSIRDLDKKEMSIDFDMCDGSLCSICPGYTKCGIKNEKR